MGSQTLPQFAPARECCYDDIWFSADGLTWEKMDVQRPAWPSGCISRMATIAKAIIDTLLTLYDFFLLNHRNNRISIIM